MLKQFVNTLLDDYDRDAADPILVIGVAAEGPVRRAARDIREGGTQVQEAVQALALDAHRRARGPMCRSVEGAAIAGHGDRRISLEDEVLDELAGVLGVPGHVREGHRIGVHAGGGVVRA